MRNKLGVILFISFDFCFPRLEFCDESIGHPTVFYLVHIVAKVNDIVCTSRVNTCDIYTIATTRQNGSDVRCIFYHLDTVHKIAEREAQIASCCNLGYSLDLNGAIHKVEHKDYLKRIFYIVYHPVITISYAFRECSTSRSCTSIIQMLVNICNSPLIIGLLWLVKSLI